MTNIWLSEWSNDFSANYTTWTQSEVDRQRNVRLGVYGALGCGQGEHGVYVVQGHGHGEPVVCGALGCQQGEPGVYGAHGCGNVSLGCIGHRDMDKVSL